MKGHARIGIMSNLLVENDMHWVVSESWGQVNDMCNLEDED